MAKHLLKSGLLVSVLLALLSLAAYLWLQRDLQPAAGFGSGTVQAVAVVVTQPRQVRLQDRVEALGTTQANESVVISSKQTERVAEVLFTEGQRVERGQMLVQLHSGSEQAELDLARSERKEAQREYNRIRKLVAEQKVAELELDRLASSIEQAQARIDRAQVLLNEHVIRAPFAGVIGLRQVSPGTLLMPGMPITTLDDISVIKLDFTVPERYLARVQVGDSIVARSQAFADTVFKGRLDLLSPRVDPASRAFTARALIDNPDHLLRPGMLMRVDLLYDSRVALVLPEAAVFGVGEAHYVLLVTPDNLVEQRRVEAGSRRAGEVEISNGLSADERVILRGRLKVRPGQQVTLQQESWRESGGAASERTAPESTESKRAGTEGTGDAAQ